MSHRSSGGLPYIHRWAGLSGVGAAVLFAVANALWAFDQPSRGASGPELLDFYGDLSGRIVAGALLSLISIALFVVFASALRSVLIELEGDELLANIAFGGALLGMAAGVGAETINMAAALRAGDGELTESLAQALFDSSYVLGYNAAGSGSGCSRSQRARRRCEPGRCCPAGSRSSAWRSAGPYSPRSRNTCSAQASYSC